MKTINIRTQKCFGLYACLPPTYSNFVNDGDTLDTYGSEPPDLSVPFSSHISERHHSPISILTKAKELYSEGRQKWSQGKVCLEDVFSPDRSDVIEVLRTIENIRGKPEMWCLAAVLYVQQHSSTNCLMYGAILYPEGDGSEKEVHEVDFLPRRLLRRMRMTLGRTKINHSHGVS